MEVVTHMIWGSEQVLRDGNCAHQLQWKNCGVATAPPPWPLLLLAPAPVGARSVSSSSGELRKLLSSS